MTMSSKAVCLSVILLLGLVDTSSCRHETPAVCQEFYNLSGQQQEKEFSTYSVEKQLEIYRCEMGKKPPASGWAYDIAKNGEKSVPAVLAKLKGEKDETMQYHLIYIFQVMAEKGHLRERQDVSEQIKQVIAQMKYSVIKEQAQEALNEIEKNVRSSSHS